MFCTGEKKKSKIYDFQKFNTVRSFGGETSKGIIALNDTFDEQINLKDVIDKFSESPKPKTTNKKRSINS